MHATQFVASYFDAWNHGDAQGVADHLTADGIYVDVPQNMERTHDELIVVLHDYFSPAKKPLRFSIEHAA